MITQNFSSQPTFYGCDATDETPLVLYLPNSPWTGYSNFSYTKGAFTNEQLNDTLENAFQLTTYGNGTIDSEWPSCLACATIKRSLARMDMNLPDQCKKCFERHCWHGKESNARVTEADLDLRPRLNPDLTFAEWNRTVWEPDQSNFNVTEEDGKTGGASIFRGGSAVVLAGAAAAVLLVT
jgi:lysophospholipase